MVDGPLHGKLGIIKEPRAYELFYSHTDIREHWYFYRIHPLDSDSVKNRKEATVDLDKQKEIASKVLAAKPGRGAGTVAKRIKADIRYLYVKEVDETYRCVIAFKEKHTREGTIADIYNICKFKESK